MNNFNFYNGFNLWSPIQPASFTDSLSYLQHIEILREKINEVVENLNNANFYARGLKPGKAIDIVGATQGSGFFNGEDPTIINTVINNSVLTDNKPGWHRIFTTKVITEDLKSGLTFLFQEQPLNHNCENDKLSWGILKINFVYNPTDADVDYNTYNIKIVDFAFEEERNLTDKLDRFMLVRRISPCNAENVMELYYKVPTKEEATECADACGPAGLFTLLNIDNKEIDFNTYIKLENEGLNTTTYDGINGVKTNPVINFDYDDITLIGDTEGYGLMNTRNVKVEPTTTPQLIDSFDTTGDVDMRKVNVLKNHRPYDDVPKTNDIVFNMEVPKLIDNIRVENTGVVEGNGSVVVPEVLGAENNIAITIENSFNEDAIKDKVEQYAPKTDIIPPDGSKVLYLAPVDGNDTMDGLSVDTAMKSMTALLNKNYAKEIVVHLVGEPPVSEGEGTIIVNGANYSKITIIDENSILSGYSLEVNNSNVIISNTSTAAGSGSLSLRNDYNEDIEEVLIEEDTVIDYDPNTQRVHYNTYTFKPRMYSLSKDETEEDIEEITETYYSIRPLTLTQNTIYSLEANNSIIDIQGTFTDIFNCKLDHTTFNNSINNLNIITLNSSDSDIESVGCSLHSVEVYNNNLSIDGILIMGPGSLYSTKIDKLTQLQTSSLTSSSNYINMYDCFGTMQFNSYTKNINFYNCNFKCPNAWGGVGNKSYSSVWETIDSRYNFLEDTRFITECFNTIENSRINNIFYSTKSYPKTQIPYNNCPGNVIPDGTTITINDRGVISAKGGGVVEEGVGFVPIDNNAVELYVNFSGGNDSNDGLTSETALKTIEKALNKRVSKYIKLHLINPFFSLDGSTNNDYVNIIGDGYDKIEVVEWSGTTGTTSLNIFNTDFVWNVNFEIKLNKVINSNVSFVYNQNVKNIELLEANNSTFNNTYTVRITLKTLNNIHNCNFNGNFNFESGNIYNSSIFTTDDTTVNNTDFNNCYIPFIKITNTGSSNFFIGCDIGNMTINSASTNAITIQDSTVDYLLNNLNSTLKINLLRSSINIVNNFNNIEEFYAYVKSAFNIQTQKSVINGINFTYNEPKKNNFIATTNSAGFVKPDGQSILIDSEGVIRSTYTLPIATDSVLGGVKQGSTVQISADGTLNVNPDNIAFDTRLIPQNKDNITYYVDPINGIDTNDGLTTSTQLKTIEAALNKHSSQNITIDLANADFTISPLLDLFGYKQVKLLGSTRVDSNISELTVKNGTLIIQKNNTTIGTLNGENAYITGDLKSLNNLKLINSEYITSKPTTSFNLSSLILEHSTIKSTNTFNITASNPYIINSCIDNMNNLSLTKDSIFTIDGLTGYIQNKLTITGTSTSDIVKNCKMSIGDLTATNVSFMNCDFNNTNIKGDNTYNFGIVLNLSNVQIDNSNICGKSWKLSNTSINGCNITGNIGTGSNIDNTNKGVGNNMIFNFCHSGQGGNWVLSYCNIIGADSTYFSSATKSVINGTYVS